MPERAIATAIKIRGDYKRCILAVPAARKRAEQLGRRFRSPYWSKNVKDIIPGVDAHIKQMHFRRQITLTSEGGPSFIVSWWTEKVDSDAATASPDYMHVWQYWPGRKKAVHLATIEHPTWALISGTDRREVLGVAGGGKYPKYLMIKPEQEAFQAGANKCPSAIFERDQLADPENPEDDGWNQWNTTPAGHPRVASPLLTEWEDSDEYVSDAAVFRHPVPDTEHKYQYAIVTQRRGGPTNYTWEQVICRRDVTTYPPEFTLDWEPRVLLIQKAETGTPLQNINNQVEYDRVIYYGMQNTAYFEDRYWAELWDTHSRQAGNKDFLYFIRDRIGTTVDVPEQVLPRMQVVEYNIATNTATVTHTWTADPVATRKGQPEMNYYAAVIDDPRGEWTGFVETNRLPLDPTDMTVDPSTDMIFKFNIAPVNDILDDEGNVERAGGMANAVREDFEFNFSEKLLEVHPRSAVGFGSGFYEYTGPYFGGYSIWCWFPKVGADLKGKKLHFVITDWYWTRAEVPNWYGFGHDLTSAEVDIMPRIYYGNIDFTKEDNKVTMYASPLPGALLNMSFYDDWAVVRYMDSASAVADDFGPQYVVYAAFNCEKGTFQYHHEASWPEPGDPHDGRYPTRLEYTSPEFVDGKFVLWGSEGSSGMYPFNSKYGAR